MMMMMMMLLMNQPVRKRKTLEVLDQRKGRIPKVEVKSPQQKGRLRKATMIVMITTMTTMMMMMKTRMVIKRRQRG